MKCKYPDEVCASMTVLNGVAYCDSVPCVLRDEIPPMTNADRIRSLSDEELEEFLQTVKCRGAVAEACDTFWEDDSYGIDWLRQPAGDGTE